MSTMVKTMGPQQGGLGNLMKIGEIAGGVMTGDPMLIAGGALSGSNSPAGKALGLYNSYNQLDKNLSGPAPAPSMNGDFSNALGGQDFSNQLGAMGRMMVNKYGANPNGGGY